MSARRSATPPATARLRCAIYTRKSSEEGLDQSFNSLHAQREACEAYVLSQAGEGWTALPQLYDDGGFSGGDMERPGLKALMADVDAGRIDVVVVYKVDRLTRALADFAKIVERFDARGVSFVSVTQAFNTTTSMGRLTLNVLLSFAQFEREVTGERIRDKIAASKAKGMWMGGAAPLGYDGHDRTLKINEAEAQIVRLIFARYLELGSVHRLRDDMEARGVVTKRHNYKEGGGRGGGPFQRGALFHLLSNRTYLGEIVHKELTHPGLHPAIVDRDTFDRVQTLLARKAGPKRRALAGLAPNSPTSPLSGLVHDDAGHRMSPVGARKPGGLTYRYLVSTAVLKGRSEAAGSLPRFPTSGLEALVADRLERLGLAEVEGVVRRVEVGRAEVRIRLRPDLLDEHAPERLLDGDELSLTGGDALLICPVRLQRRGGGKVMVGARGRPAVETPTLDLTLARALAKAELWKARLAQGEVASLAELAAQQKVDAGYLRRALRLAFLSPALKHAVLDGSAPTGLTLQHFMTRDLPLCWAQQERTSRQAR